ncbi:MAG: thermonuclease family protein, partial [Chitinophagaceae bacterium]
YKTDLYGRLLVSATFNGMSLDSLLIAKGWVWFYSVYSQRMDLKNIENAAKHNCLGLWNCTQPVPP